MQVIFQNNFSLQEGFDGGVLEVSFDDSAAGGNLAFGGRPWRDGRAVLARHGIGRSADTAGRSAPHRVRPAPNGQAGGGVSRLAQAV